MTLTKNLIIRAARMAQTAHFGVPRDHGCHEPYVMHVMRVAGRVSLLPGATKIQVAASWGHDIKEDCKPKVWEWFASEMPKSVVELVIELTNPSKKRPELPRPDRKAMDREHLVKCSLWARAIKLIDRDDNVRSLDGAKPAFRLMYLEESVLLMDALEKSMRVSERPLLYPSLVVLDESIRRAREQGK